MHGPRTLWWALTVGALLLVAAPAEAESGVVLPVNEHGDVVVEMSDTDSGITGKLVALNLSDRAVAVSIEDERSDGACDFDVSPNALAPNSSVTLEITSTSCALPEPGLNVSLAVEGGKPLSRSVRLEPAATESVQLAGLLWPFLLAAILAGGVLFWRCRPEAEGSATPSSWRDPVRGAPADWSFKDSWVSNISIGSAVFVALFGAKDAVAALLGDAEETAVAQLVLVAAVSALLVGLAPLVLALDQVEGKPTCLTLVAGGVVTLTGVLGQVLGVFWVFSRSGPWTPNDALALLLALLLGGFVLVYAVITLRRLIRTAPEPDPPSEAVLLAAAVLAAAPPGLLAGHPQLGRAVAYIEGAARCLPEPPVCEEPVRDAAAGGAPLRTRRSRSAVL